MLLKETKEIKVIDDSGKERVFFLSKMPACDGLEIMMKWPAHIVSAAVIPKMADWDAIMGLRDKIMRYVGIDMNGNIMPLNTPALVDNHCGDWTCLGTLLVEEVKYNHPFLRDGKSSATFAKLGVLFRQKLIELFTLLSAQSSPESSPPSTNSEPSTALKTP